MIVTRNGGNGQIKIIGVPDEEMKRNETINAQWYQTNLSSGKGI